jgi:ParB-like chromosome segregation protein Spo0J
MLHDIHTQINQIKSLNDPLDQAKIVAQLRQSNTITSADLARELGVKPSHISHLIRVLKLPDTVIDGYMSKVISFTHLVIISRLRTSDAQIQLYEEILAKSLSISQVEKRVREILFNITSDGSYVSNQTLKQIEQRVSHALHNAEVHVVQSRIRARITIDISGNLEKTTSFLEMFASRFRKRKKQSEEAFQNATPLDVRKLQVEK